jgi:hypothetical protein
MLSAPTVAFSKAFVVLATTTALASCASPPPPVDPSLQGLGTPRDADLRAARERLEVLRRATEAPRTRHIALELREPRSGRVLSARGAVAIQPPRALRMILLGPGGTTALDLWVDGDRYRFAVPAIDLQKRGDLRAPREERRGLPVDFLAYWLLHPASGELAWASRDDAGERLVLRDGMAMVDLRARDDGRLEAHRATWSSPERPGATPRLLEDETVAADGLGCARVRYHQGSTGLDVTVTCEKETLGEPPARALADPDAEAPR